MTEILPPEGNDDGKMSLASMPKTALQAIYHAVTGKTETISRDLQGNVEIGEADIDRLYECIIDQVRIHPPITDPTVTVVIKSSDDKTTTYSSWARFKNLLVSNHDLTSDITLKIEFVTQLPNTNTPQRCIINVTLDSSLPVISSQNQELKNIESLGFMVFMNTNWRTVQIKIDFVDYLIAKSFVSNIEEWFKSLKKISNSKINNYILSHRDFIQSSISQMGRIGMAAYLIMFVSLVGTQRFNLNRWVIGFSIGLILWSFLIVSSNVVARRIFKRINSTVIPTVILLTDRDKDVYGSHKEGIANPAVTFLNTLLYVISAVGLNVIASYIYAWMTAR